MVAEADADADADADMFDIGAFFEEFRVGYDAFIQHDLCSIADLVSGADGDSGFVDDVLLFGHVLGNAARHGQNILEIGGAVFIRRRADSDELKQAVINALLCINGEREAACFMVAFHHFLKARFKNRDTAAVQKNNFYRIYVDALHIDADLSKACADNKTYIAASEYGDIHTNRLSKADYKEFKHATAMPSTWVAALLRVHFARKRRILQSGAP